ncbi:MAG: histidine phosphatase family protein [Chloroflexota bacterium]|nr:MAG: histidine phosphatase family protein [Chloroflexota bacterium]
MATNLYLIRHGEAVSNVEPFVMGGMKGCRGLTERGIAQVRLLARRLSSGEIPADVLYASTLPRARQTAEAVAEALGLPIHWDDDLQELRPGDADGMTYTEARQRFESMQLFLKRFFTPIATGGESWGAFVARASSALERIISRHQGQHIVVVCHGGIIEASFLHLLQLGPHVRGRAAFHVRNTAITHWRQVETQDERQEWQLIAHNDHWHLHELERDTGHRA